MLHLRCSAIVCFLAALCMLSGCASTRVGPTSATTSSASTTPGGSALQITITSLPSGVVGLPYSVQMTGSGGTPPYNWSIISGSLPSSLTLSGNGLLSGTQLTAGTFTATIQVSDSGGKTANQAFSVTFSAKSNSTTYYVATNGNDSSPCTSNAAPCKTISHAVSLASPGDIVAVHAGIYYEMVHANNSGTSGNPITLLNYGDGPPIIDASDTNKFSSWMIDSGVVYSAKYNGASPVGGGSPGPCTGVDAVIIDNVPLTAATQFCNPAPRSSVTINPGQWFFDINTSTLYVYTSDGSSPAAHDLVVVWDVNHGSNPQLVQALDAVDVGDYWNISGITIRGAGNYGLTMGNHGLLNNSTIWFNAWTGTSFGTNSTITNNTVAWNMMANWPRGRCENYNANQSSIGYPTCWIWGNWGGGLLIGGGFSTVIGNSVYMNGGEGLISYLGAGNNYVHGNNVHDNWSVNIYMDSEPNDDVDGNLVYCNDPQASWTMNSGAASSIDLRKRIRPIGISTADECYSGCGAAQSHDMTVINNVIVGCKRGLDKYTQAPGSGLINELWAHNTIVLPTTNGIDYVDGGSGDDRYCGIMIPSSNTNSGTITDNIIYGQGTTNVDVFLVYGSSAAVSLSGINLNHNLYYHTSNSSPFNWDDGVSQAVTYTYSAWEALLSSLGLGTGDVTNQDPSMQNPTSFAAYPDKSISNASPAAGKGAATSRANVDFNGYSYNAVPSDGAFEVGSVPK